MKLNLLIAVLFLTITARISSAMTPDEALALYEKTDDVSFNTPFTPTQDPGAQWYPNAGFGLFIHWGIYAQTPVNPSWSMMENVFGKAGPAKLPKDQYYAQAEVFNPKNYDPNRWLKMASSIGMQYAVMTAKHHDGYCMWPTRYGKYNTKNYMDGRDLVKEYVDACRKNGLKVGLYFSPRDWAYNDHTSMFDHVAKNFDWFNTPDWPFEGEENEREYDKWLAYTLGQLSELLTQYGQVDVLWFDGVHWKGVNRPADDRTVRTWIYRLQPQIAINPRWGGKPTNPDYDKHDGHHSLGKISSKVGDFYTYESRWSDMEARNPGMYSDIWYEYCETWKGHWGHVPATSAEPDLQHIQQIAYRLTTLTSFGGNYLLNIGPDRDGENRPDILAEAAILSKWMTHSKKALVNTQPVKFWEAYSSVPLTRSGSTVYAHLPAYKGKYSLPIEIRYIDRPLDAVVLHSGQVVRPKYDSATRTLTLDLPDASLDPQKIGTIIAIHFGQEQSFPKTDVTETTKRSPK
jgi:alpha-L-fucosidase